MKPSVIINIAAPPTTQAAFKLAIETQALERAPDARVCGIYLRSTDHDDLPQTMRYLYTAHAVTGQIIALG